MSPKRGCTVWDPPTDGRHFYGLTPGHRVWIESWSRKRPFSRYMYVFMFMAPECMQHTHTALSRTNGQSRGSPMPGNVWTRTIIPFFRPFWPCRLLHAVLSTVASVVLPDRNNGWLFGRYTKSTGSSGMWKKFKKKFLKIWKPKLGQQLGCNRTSQFCGHLSELLVVLSTNCKYEHDCLYRTWLWSSTMWVIYLIFIVFVKYIV